MTKKDRLKEAFEYLRSKGVVHTQKDVASRMRTTPPNVSSAFRGDERVLTDSFIERFSNAFNNISYYWLLTGEGNMVKDDGDAASSTPTEAASDVCFVSLLPIAAHGGSLNDFVVSVKESDCERVVSPIKGADFAMTVAGDSMSPEYPNGSQILIKKINEKAFLEWGKTYVLDTCNGTVIKILIPSQKEGYVKCVSINPDERYAPFDVSMSDIFGIYRVMLCMSVK